MIKSNEQCHAIFRLRIDVRMTSRISPAVLKKKTHGLDYAFQDQLR